MVLKAQCVLENQKNLRTMCPSDNIRREGNYGRCMTLSRHIASSSFIPDISTTVILGLRATKDATLTTHTQYSQLTQPFPARYPSACVPFLPSAWPRSRCAASPSPLSESAERQYRNWKVSTVSMHAEVPLKICTFFKFFLPHGPHLELKRVY